ncbi:MAG: inverse autotransporter beta domain-containing protein, partial [Candidatus Omnitrophota bacterium]
MVKKKLLFLTFFLLLPSISFAQETQKSVCFLPDYPTKISPGFTVTDARTLNYIDIFIPTIGTEQGFFFFNPKIVLEGSNDANEQNIGCGYRQLLFDDNLMVGANLFYDRRKSKTDRQHHQLAFGFESFITEWLDLRTNFYYPISGYKNLGT